MRFFRNLFIGLLAIVGLLVLLYFAGPRPEEVNLEAGIVSLPVSIENVEAFIANKEARKSIKPDNAAKIVWADSNQQQTEWAIVYLHGYSASHHEGFPLHERLAQTYGYNLYLSRLEQHGLAIPNPMEDMDAALLVESAKEAIAIGNILGEKVCVMSCSTGGTLSLYLAAHNPEWIDGLICYSPNIEIKDPKAKLLSGPWAHKLATATLGGEYYEPGGDATSLKYWYGRYHSDGLIALQMLLKESMTDATFQAVDQPIFIGYYYKDAEAQDQVVSVDAITDMIPQLGTDETEIVNIAFPDAAEHVISSDLKNPNIEKVYAATQSFVEEKLHWRE